MIEQYRFQKRSWISTKRKELPENGKLWARGLKQQKQWQQPPQKPTTKQQSGNKGDHAAAALFISCAISREHSFHFGRLRFHEKQKDHRITTSRHKLREFRKKEKLEEILTGKAWLSLQKNEERGGKKKCPDVQKIVLKKKKEMEIAAATETRARDKRRDETRRDKQARRGDATLLPSRFLKLLEVSKSRTPNRGPHLGDPKTIGTSYFSFYQFLKKCIFEILLYLLKRFFLIIFYNFIIL